MQFALCERIWFAPIIDCRVLGFKKVGWTLSLCRQLMWLTAKKNDYVQVCLERLVRGFHNLLVIVTSFRVFLSFYAVPWVSLSSVTLRYSHFISLKPRVIPLCYFINPNTDKCKVQGCDLSTVLGECVYSSNILAEQLCIQVLPWVNPVSEKNHICDWVGIMTMTNLSPKK